MIFDMGEYETIYIILEEGTEKFLHHVAKFC